jgi:hypothetical protein
LIVLTFAWLTSSILAPTLMAKRSLRLGHDALNRKQYAAARRHLERAARHEPLREQAVCLAAEADLLDRRPSEALYALNTLLLEQDQSGKPRSPRVRLLRGLAGCLVGRAAAARRELGAIPKTDASVDELLAAAQACILCNDAAGAQLLLEQLTNSPLQPIAGPLAARVQLCRAALYFRLGAWEKCLEALPVDSDCSPRDAITCRRVRLAIEEKLAEERAESEMEEASM